MHTHGLFRAMVKPLWLHARDYFRLPEYRALHRFARQLRHQSPNRPAMVRFQSKPIVVPDAPSFLSAWDEIFVNRTYDIGPVSSTPRLVDVGANIGLAAMYWKHRYGTFDYVGFEPDPAIAAVCRQNLAAWGITGQVEGVAVAAVEGTVAFQSDGADAGRIAANRNTAAARAVRAVRLGPYLDEPVDLLKLDIEGTELEVLRDVENRLTKVRRVFVEVHAAPVIPPPLGAVLSLLERQGFRSHVHVGYAAPQPLLAQPVSPAGFESLVSVFAMREQR